MSSAAKPAAPSAPAPVAVPSAPAAAAAPAEVKCSKCDELEERLARIEKYLDKKFGFWFFLKISGASLGGWFDPLFLLQLNYTIRTND